MFALTLASLAQRKTLELLYQMANPVNVEFIADKLLEFLGQTNDEFLRRDLTSRIIVISEKFAPTNSWYIMTVTKLFSIEGDLVKSEVAQNLMTLLAEGSGDDDEDEDEAMRLAAVEQFASMLDDKQMPAILLQTMAWSLGEYSYLLTKDPDNPPEYDLPSIITKLCALARQTTTDSTSRRYLCLAVMKLVSQLGTCPGEAARLVDDYTTSRDVFLQQTCLEFQELLTTAVQHLGSVFPIDASCEDVGVDENLTIMQGFVDAAVANGAAVYSASAESDDEDESPAAAKPVFNTTPYAKPETRPNLSLQSLSTPSASTESATSASPEPELARPSEVGLRLSGVANVWGPSAVVAMPAQTPVAAAPVAAAPVAFAPAPTTPQPAAALFDEPKVMSEKEKMAAALFGGVGGGGSSKVSEARSERRANERMRDRKSSKRLAGSRVCGVAMLATRLPF